MNDDVIPAIGIATDVDDCAGGAGLGVLVSSNAEKCITMDNEIKDLSERIKELGDKSTQLLTFLSFALAVAVLLWSSSVSASQKSSLVLTMRWWVRAIFPILVGIVPVKEFRENNLRWYNFLRWFKFVLLWVAVIFIFYGVILFARSLAALAK